MATNHPRPLLGPAFVAWVSSLKPERERLIWCDECHYWHGTINECAYVTKAGA